MNWFKTITLGLLAILVALLCIQNLGPVELTFLVWSMSLPKIVLILLTYLAGMLTGWGLVEIIKRWYGAGGA
ncbi:MAG TPA: hypothetical protein PKA06_02495 [Gemmatales bacterium]|nr:hypothetical protein [Gemmatales bacterium]